MKINNKVISHVKTSMGEDTTYQMFDYMEDVKKELQRELPYLLLIHKSAGMKNETSELSKEIALLDFIEENRLNIEMRYITNESLDDHFHQRLIEKGFYQIVPISKIEFLEKPPKNKEELYYLFNYKEWKTAEQYGEEIYKVDRKRTTVFEELEQERRRVEEETSPSSSASTSDETAEKQESVVFKEKEDKVDKVKQQIAKEFNHFTNSKENKNSNKDDNNDISVSEYTIKNTSVNENDLKGDDNNKYFKENDEVSELNAEEGNTFSGATNAPPTNVLKKDGIDQKAIEFERPLVSVFWSPIPNVGVNSIVKAIGYTLASLSRKVLIIELDTELAKLARTTSLTHSEKDIYKALTGLETQQDNAIVQNIVNKDLAMEDLPFNFKQARAKLRELPSELYVLSRNSKISKKDEPTINDESVIERMFYQAKQSGFRHILVDVPSSPHNLFTTLSFLYADERFAVVDEHYGTSGIFKNAMEELDEILFTKDDFELIINGYTDEEILEHVREVYDMTPVLEIPYDDEIVTNHHNLLLYGGEVFMDEINQFVTRYGVAMEEKEKKKKRFAIFG